MEPAAAGDRNLSDQLTDPVLEEMLMGFSPYSSQLGLLMNRVFSGYSSVRFYATVFRVS
jgi:hypothetical protein